jgi:hypothetical protein
MSEYNDFVFFLVGTGTVELIDMSEEGDEIVTVTESPDGKSSVVKTTFTYPNGNVKTFMAVQTLDENGKLRSILSYR